MNIREGPFIVTWHACNYFKEETNLDPREWLCIPTANTYDMLTFIYRRQYSHNTPSSILPVCASLRSSTGYGCQYVCPWYMSALPRSCTYGAGIGTVMTWASGTSHPMSPCVPYSQYRLLMHLSGPATTTNCSGFRDKVENMEIELLTESSVSKWHVNCKYWTQMFDLWTGNNASIWNKWSKHMSQQGNCSKPKAEIGWRNITENTVRLRQRNISVNTVRLW